MTDLELAWAAGLFEGEGTFKLWNGRWCGSSFVPDKFNAGRARFCTRYCQQEWFKRKRRKSCVA